MKLFISSIGILLLTASLSFADAYEDFWAAVNKGDSKTIDRLLKEFENKGMPPPLVYEAIMYKNGQGVEKDIKKAINIFNLAAKNGEKFSQYNLGLLYETGEGVKKDILIANNYYELAAEQGLKEAQQKLGLMYFTGGGIWTDNVLAYFWLTLSGSKEKNVKKKLKFLKDNMPSQEIKEANKMLKDWSPKKDNRTVSHYQGKYLSKNLRDHVQDLEKWAKKGEPEAQRTLGGMFLRGEMVPKNPKMALKLFKDAANAGDLIAQHHLIGMYYSGKAIPKNHYKAYIWALIAIANSKNMEDEKYYLDSIRFTKSMIEGPMKQEIKDKAKKEASEWKPQK